MTDADYIVVGAGSAGCIVARRLADSGNRSVLLLEAGGDPERQSLRRPADYVKMFGGPSDWDYITEPSPGLAGRRLRWPRGRGPGGSTRINAMIWMPPTAADLQTLCQAGGPTWHPELLADDLHQVEQWVLPEAPRWISEASRRFLRAAEKITAGAHPYQRMNRRGERVTAADLLAAPQRRQVRCHTATVASIVLQDDRAVGVRTLQPAGGEETLRAARGVVLCAGTIATPLLLMRSGIGPRSLLDGLGIPVRLAQPAVGSGLCDHLIVPVIWSTPSVCPFPPTFSVADLARWQHGGSGPVTSNLAEAGGLLTCGDGRQADQVQLHVTPTHYLRYPGPTAPAAMTIGVTDPRPQSRGRLALASQDPRRPPRIEPDYLSDPTDIDRLLMGVELARRIAHQSPLAGWLGEEQSPGQRRCNREDLQRYVARFAQTLYHPVGTCALGRDAHAVVDPQLAVRGARRLWIADGSVLPAIPSVNPNAAIMMLAHRLAGWLP